MMPQQYCLRWKHHHSNVQNMFAQLLEKERFCDVTLYCSPSFASQVPNKDTVEPHSIRGVSLRAHRVVLAACSELLGTLLGAHEAHGEPVLVIDGAEPRHLRALLDYMYTGEMNVHHSQLASLLKTAEELRIKGLTDIRWNNKDEPPDCASVATTTLKQDTADKPDTETETKQKPSETKHKPAETKHKPAETKHKPAETKHKPAETKHKSEAKKNAAQTLADVHISEPRTLKEDIDKVNINGGPPPLIKLPLPKSLMTPKRENSDSDSPSPKRRRVASGADNTDDESNHTIKLEKDGEWQHGSMDISASRVGWGGMSGGSQSDDEWADAPADIGSFLHTRLRVDGDNSADEESNDSSAVGHTGRDEGSPILAPTPPLKTDPLAHVTIKRPKSGPTDPRFTDVIKLNDYLQHGRRPQFWEEHYVKRVMEAVRLKELEMKQAAEILGVSYGTLYGRYRDVYGCINRPYSTHVHRAVRDFWQVKGPSEVLERLQRGELSLEAAAGALGVSVANLAAHLADFPHPHPPTLAEASVKYESFPIEIDQSLRARSFSSGPTNKPLVRIAPKVSKMSTNEDELIPASIISTGDAKEPTSAGAGNTAGGKWPTIRVASIDSLRSEPPAPASPSPSPSPSQLMRTRPDLTIVAKRPDSKEDT